MKENIGGQAVIEGVMMRAPDAFSVAVRKQNKKIVTIRHAIEKVPWTWRMPILRGVYKLYEMLKIAMYAIGWSASEAYDDERALSKKEMFFVIVSSGLMAILLFNLLPYALPSIGGSETQEPVLFNIVDAIIKFVIFLGYVSLLGLMPDARRLFEYHGAEHMVVNCYEEGKRLTIANIRKYSTIHKRCGTNFIMIVFIAGIFLFSFVPTAVEYFFPPFTSLAFLFKKTLLFLFRLALVPLVAGISYEILKINSTYNIPLLSLFTAPGLLMQRLTTRQPDKDQIKVAIAAMNSALDKG